jgi:hypothetical protein
MPRFSGGASRISNSGHATLPDGGFDSRRRYNVVTRDIIPPKLSSSIHRICDDLSRIDPIALVSNPPTLAYLTRHRPG